MQPIPSSDKVDKLVQGVKTNAETRRPWIKPEIFVKRRPRTNPPSSFHCVGKEATKEAIRSIGDHKAVGVDGLPCSFWKSYCEELWPFVKNVINTSILTGTYPNHVQRRHRHPRCIREARKKGWTPASYRPVSVLPALSKVLDPGHRGKTVHRLLG